MHNETAHIKILHRNRARSNIFTIIQDKNISRRIGKAGSASFGKRHSGGIYTTEIKWAKAAQLERRWADMGSASTNLTKI